MPSFEETKTKCDVMLASLSTLDYKSLKMEIRGACREVRISSNTMTPNDLSKDMELIQAGRDRIIEIIADAQENSMVRKDVAKLMTAAAKKNSSESSSDRRDGDAVIKVTEYILGHTEAESFYKYCEIMYAGLTNKYNAVGKRIACMQESVRINTFGGGSSMVSDTALPRNTSNTFDKAPTPSSGDGTQTTDWDDL